MLLLDPWRPQLAGVRTDGRPGVLHGRLRPERRPVAAERLTAERRCRVRRETDGRRRGIRRRGQRRHERDLLDLVDGRLGRGRVEDGTGRRRLVREGVRRQRGIRRFTYGDRNFFKAPLQYSILLAHESSTECLRKVRKKYYHKFQRLLINNY